MAWHCIGVGWRETYGAALRSGLRGPAGEVGGVGGVDLVFEGEHLRVAVLVMVVVMVMVRGARGEWGGGGELGVMRGGGVGRGARGEWGGGEGEGAA